MSDQNDKLLSYVKKLGEHPTGYRIAHLRFSELPAARKTRDNLTRAIKEFAQLKAKFNEGELFLLKNMDVVFITHLIQRPVLANTCDEMQRAFTGRATQGMNAQHSRGGDFFTLYELSLDYAKALAWAESTTGETNSQGPGARRTADASMMTRIKEEILHTDIASMLFNQPAYDISDPNSIKPMFNETYISVGVLEQIFCPGLSLTARRWLFADLTEDLDTVVLRFLADPRERQTRNQISLNLNISTLASEKFAQFDSEISPEYRKAVLLEVGKTDMFENMGTFRKIAPGLRQKGYRLALDGLTMDVMLSLDLDGMEVDYAKVFWDNDFHGLSPEEVDRVKKKKMMRPQPRFILARCDNAESLRFARSVGVTVLQGRLIDHMMRSKGGL